MDNVIAFVNPKSGGQLGEAVFEQLKKHLSAENIFNLKQGGPKAG